MASNQKSLEEMLSSEVDESAITALVSQLERPMSGENSATAGHPINRHQSKAVLIDGLTASANAHNTNTTSAINTINTISANSVHNNSNSSNLQTILNTNAINSSVDNKLKIIVNNNNNTNNSNNNNLINVNTNSNNNNNNNNPLINSNNKLLSQSLTTTSGSLPGALPASGYLNQNLNMNSVSSGVSGGVAANQIIKSAISVSSLPNGSPSGSGSPSPLQQSLQSSSNAINRSSGVAHNASTTISLSAITPSLVITPNKSSGVSGVTPKPGQTLLIATTKDGPMIVQPSGNPLTHPNSANTASSEPSNTTSAGTVPTTSSIVTIASRNIVSSGGVGAGANAQQSNLMQQLVSNHNNQIQFQLVTNVNTSRPQTPTANITNRALAPRLVQLPPNVRLTPQLIRPGNSTGFAGQGTITLPSNMIRAGTIFVKTENGQVHMVNVAPPPTSNANASPNMPQTTYRLQVPTTSAPTARNLTNQHQIVLPVSMTGALQNKSAAQPSVQSVNQPLHISTAAVNQQSSATTPSQMSPNTAKKKCKNFLSTLIRLASDQPPNVANNVKNLIQGLIDDAIQPEDFTNQLQKELNSSPQPCLVPFLRKSLPYLRYSLMQKELTIEGVRPPPTGAVSLPPQSQNIPQIQIAQTPRPGLTPTVRLLTPVSGLMAGQTTTVLTPLSQGTAQRLPPPSTIIRTQSTPTTTSSRSSSKSSSSKSRVNASKDKEKKNNFSSSLRDDDDINDVAAMGGVNLQEESQRILATNADIVGQQIRSCKDQDFLFTTPLHKRINQIAVKHGLDDCSQEVVSLVSHAVQERLKSLVEKLGVIAEHRQEQIKNYPNYEVLQDVKGQVMFLQELDRIEKRKHEEQEREVLIKAAKSRSKADDPDHLAIKMRAKEMQRQEMEDQRQREANETALLAIGNPKKRLKTSLNTITTPSNSSPFSSSASNIGLNSNSLTFNSTSLKPRRIKRVSLKDLHFLMEMEKETVRTPMLYKAYLK